MFFRYTVVDCVFPRKRKAADRLAYIKDWIGKTGLSINFLQLPPVKNRHEVGRMQICMMLVSITPSAPISLVEMIGLTYKIPIHYCIEDGQINVV